VGSDSIWSNGLGMTFGKILGSLKPICPMPVRECVSSVLGSKEPERGVVLVDSPYFPLFIASKIIQFEYVCAKLCNFI
jgi:hypothetical protein